MAPADGKPWPRLSGWGSRRRDQGGTANTTVLRGPKTPHWACGNCKFAENWASRLSCKGCGRNAPAPVAAKARQAHKDHDAQAAEARHDGAQRGANPRGGSGTSDRRGRQSDIRGSEAREGSEASSLDDAAVAAEGRGNADFAEACRQQAKELRAEAAAAKAAEDAAAPKATPATARAAENAAAYAQSALDRANSAVETAKEAFEKAKAFLEGKEATQKVAADTHKQKLMARDEMRRALAAEEAVDLDELSVEDLQERYDHSKRDEERVRKALEAKRGGGAASPAAFAPTDEGSRSAATDGDAWEHLAKEAAPKVAEEFRLYLSTQGQVDDPAKQQEMLEKIVARSCRAHASNAAGGPLLAGGRVDDEGLGGGSLPLTIRPGGGTEDGADRSRRRLTEGG